MDIWNTHEAFYFMYLNATIVQNLKHYSSVLKINIIRSLSHLS